MGGDQVLILAADHVYDMNYADLLAAHRVSGRRDRGRRHGTPGRGARLWRHAADAQGRILSFLEKPADPPGMIDQPDRAMVSMGIYVFDRRWLQEALFDSRSRRWISAMT